MTSYLFIDHTDWLEKVSVQSNNFLVGRLSDCDLEVQDGKVSRKHCRILKEEDQFFIQDLGSSNGTIVNGENVDQAKLEEGDRIIIGETALYFSQNKEGPSALQADASSSNDESTSYVKDLKDIPEDYRMDVAESLKKGKIIEDGTRRRSDYSLRTMEDEKGGVDKFVLLYQLGKSLNRKANLKEALKVTVEALQDIFNPKRCVILEKDQEDESLSPRIAWERDSGYLKENEELKISYSITKRVFDEKISLISSDAPEDPRFQGERSIVDYNIRSAMCVPLWEEEEVFGVIYVDDVLEVEAFDDEDLDLLSAIANQVAIRIKQEKLFEELKREAIIRKNFERFHSPDVAESILRESKKGKELSQELKKGELSILFVDIVEFTKRASGLSPREVAKLLQKFYDYMSSKVFEHHGGINKYMGDNVMALFGAPIEQEDHAVQAVRCAQSMIASLENAQVSAQQPYKVRIGINSGPVVHGYIGSSEVQEFTVIGKTVNTASRLEENGRPNRIIIGERTAELVKHEFNVQPADFVTLTEEEDAFTPYVVPVPSEEELKEDQESEEEGGEFDTEETLRLTPDEVPEAEEDTDIL